MNKIINKFLLTGDKFMPELHFMQGNLKHLYIHELGKVCFGHDALYSELF